MCEYVCVCLEAVCASFCCWGDYFINWSIVMAYNYGSHGGLFAVWMNLLSLNSDLFFFSPSPPNVQSIWLSTKTQTLIYPSLASSSYLHHPSFPCSTSSTSPSLHLFTSQHTSLFSSSTVLIPSPSLSPIHPCLK